jgi:uncharacterized protein
MIKSKQIIMKKLILVFAWIPLISFGQIVNNENVITVVGTAEKEVDPDWIQIGMTAKETENTKKESEIVTMENSILKFILLQGLDSSSFYIDKYSANAKYSNSSTSKFKLNKSYILKINKVKLLDAIVAKCFEFGIDNIYINQIGHSKIDSIQDVVLQDAMISAKRKANLIAKTMEIGLGKVVSFNETYRIINNQQGSYQFNDYQLDDLEVVGYGIQSRARVSSSISSQKIKLTKTVIVKYEMK